MVNTLAFGKVKFRARFKEGGRLPCFYGPTLRGAFGFTLKRVVCNMRNVSCKDCLVSSNCAYSYIFEGLAASDREFMSKYPSVPQPFIISAPLDSKQTIAEGDEFEFSVTLFGRAIELFPYIAYSFLEIEKNGIGKDRIKFDILSIDELDNKQIFSQGSNSITKPTSQFVQNEYSSDTVHDVKLQFKTPLRLRKDRKSNYHPNFRDIIAAAIRRFSILSYFYGEDFSKDFDFKAFIEPSNDINEIRSDIKIHRVTRYSGRQKRVIEMPGIVGEQEFKGVSGDYLNLLKLCEVIHLGKSASFGFGGIKVIA